MSALRLLGFNTQPPEGGWQEPWLADMSGWCFNTQPPEGGWVCGTTDVAPKESFNTQPPEGGWHGLLDDHYAVRQVSTHSRLKAAGGSVS